MIPAALLAAFVLLCLGYPTWDWYFDGLTFAMAVEGAGAGGDLAWLLHPHHLLYSPLAFAAWRAVGALGLHVRAWLVMQWLSTACAAATLALVFREARRAFPPSAALAGTVALAGTWGCWHFGTQGDTTMPMTLGVLGLYLRSGRLARDGAGRAEAATLGALLGAVILIHQAAVIFALPVALTLARAGRSRDRWRAPAVCLGTAALVSAGAYAAAAFGVVGAATPTAALGWAAGYFGADPRTGYAPGYGGWHAGNLVASGRGFLEAVAGPARVPWIGLPLAGAALLGAGLHAALVRKGRGGPGLLTWLAVHAIFFTWWKPGHARFWVVALPLWTLAAMPILAMHGGRGNPPRMRARARRRAVRNPPAWLGWAVAAWTLGALVLGPLRTEAVPGCNRFLPVADTLAARTPQGMTVVIAGVGDWASLKAYVPYIAQRPMLVLDWQFADRSRSPAAALEALRWRLEALAARGAVVVASEALAPDLDAHFLAVHGVSGAARRALFDPLRLRRVAALAPGLDLLAPSR